MAMTPPRFERVRWNTSEENACSPQMADAARGLRLAAPSKVTAGPDAVQPLCATHLSRASWAHM